MRSADLHLHSTYSDGLLAPTELAEHCNAAALKFCSLTDHDTIAGNTEFRLACVALNIATIPGVELSTEYNGASFHILGYGFDPENTAFYQHLSNTAENRENRRDAILRKLGQLNIHLSRTELATRGAGTRFGRPGIADVLVKKGIVKSFSEAFEKYLASTGAAYVPYTKINAIKAIELIQAAGGKAVVAHPGLQNRDDLVQDFIAAGVDGIEVIHPEHDEALTKKYGEMARRYQLLMTGGSDYHARPRDLSFLGHYKIDTSELMPLVERN